MNYILYWIVKIFGGIIYVLLYFPRTIKRNNIPFKGGVILAGNHSSKLNAASIIHGSNRVIHVLSKKELFDSKLGWFFKGMGCIRVDRDIHDVNAKEEAVTALKNGKAICVFPEGTVNKTKDTVMPFKYGAVSFAKKTGCPIVPFAITGKYKLFSHKVKITFGKPYYVTGDIESENKILMNKVIKLINGGNDDVIK